jgi:acyl-CoA synthetase (AMP-forming)/AMP-acid ligase II
MESGNMTEAWRRHTLGEQLARAARQFPGVTAFQCGSTARTYADADARVTRLANALIARGVGRGDRVAVMMVNSVEMVEACLAIVRAGGLCVPINFRLVAAEVVQILDDADPKLLICDAATIDVAAAAIAPERLICRCEEGPAGSVSFERLIAAGSPAPVQIALPEHEPAFLMYTSGTTGRPKGALLSHFNLLANTMNMFVSLEIGASDRRWLAGLPLFHIAGLSGLLPFLFVGGTSVILPSEAFDAARAVDVLEKEQITSCYFVPTQWQAICAVPGVLERQFVLERVTWGASVAPPSVLEAIARTFRGTRMYNVFGQTEMSPITTVLRADKAPGREGSIGKPVPSVEVRLVDPAMNDVAAGEVGEIVYRAPTAFQGYWNLPAETAAAFAEGWFHSGDLARADDEGFLYLADRKTDMIVSGGENIYCPEVEAAIDSHPAVREVAVIGVPHPKWVETPVAVISLADGAAATEQEIIDWCRARIASYKKPTRVWFIDRLPRNASGKVLKRTLREQYEE